jgi:hypothetical protein
MLGRLKMDVQDCINAYISLSERVFKQEHHRVNWKGQVQGRFDHHALEEAIKEVTVAAGLTEDALLKDESSGGCKV